jgi:amino acid adenylation domain-containing protein
MTIQDRLNRGFSRYKDNIAIQCGSRMVTYNDLEKKANRIANQVIDRDIKPGTFIGILLEDRSDLICAILGILKARCVFVPLDPGYPDQRLAIMIRRTHIRFLVCDEAGHQRLSSHERIGIRDENLHVLPFPRDTKDSPMEESWTRHDIAYSPTDKVYIYFTSGTTGEPKAIVGNNKGFVHFIDWEIDTFGVDSSFRCSQLTNPGFDVYLRDIFVPLCAGATICIPDTPDMLLDGRRLTQWLDDREIVLSHCVPSLFRTINIPGITSRLFKSLKYVLFAGEKVIPGELKNWYDTFGGRIQLVNLYGPTETTLAKLYYLIQPGDVTREIMPVGKHIRGARVIILNENGAVRETLETGEIHIRTPYRTYGYYDDPQLNAAKFIPNPFNDDPDDIIYKTGDLGRRLPDGNIELLGRVDRQVKIRGMRVELDGIENTLLKHPDVKEAVVIQREINSRHASLFALVTLAAPAGNPLEDELKSYLAGKLPQYMIPGDIATVEAIPRKINGKVDYIQVAQLVKEYKTEYAPPANAVEEKLAEIWSGLLENAEFGVTNSFFDVGGNSLTIMSMITKIHREFDVRIPLGYVFNNNTIRDLAEFIGSGEKEEYNAIVPAGEKEYYALSSSQKRLYILHQAEPHGITYNMPQMVILEGPLEMEKLRLTFFKLIQRHENLRTSFLVIDGEHVQKVHEPSQIRFEIEHYPEGASEKEVVSRFVRPFDLSGAPILRVGLLQTAPGKHLLMMDMHHIIADNISLQILVSELTALYEDRELSPLELQYKDYSEWHNRLIQSGQMKKQEDFWLNAFSGEIPVLNMPSDFPRPEHPDHVGDWVFADVEESLSRRVFRLAKHTGTTLFTFCLAVYYILLARYSGQDDIVVGTPVAGRAQPGLEGVIGIFINTIALRGYPGGEKTFLDFLDDVKENNIKAYENQDYPFENLVAKTVVDRATSRSPLFDVVFEYHEDNSGKSAPGVTGLNIVRYREYSNKKSEHDFSLHIFENPNVIGLALQYATALFKSSTAEKIIKHYVEILEKIVDNEQIKLKDIIISHDLLMANTEVYQDNQYEFEF